jgi:gluconokinase
MPETFQKVKRWLSPGEYLFQEFFGTAGCSISMASATGLFHQQSGDWDEEMLTAVGISRDSLAPLTDIDTPVHGLHGAWAERWKPLANIPWVPAIGDGAASNVGSGCVTDRRIAINIGTSGAIRVLWRQPADKPLVIPDELWCYRLDRERCLMGGAFSDGGAAFAWMRHTLNFANNPLDTSAVGQGVDLTQDALAEKALEEREPDSHGLTFLPFLGGERSIGWHPGATAILAGLTQSTSPLEILQATMEAVALRFTLVAEVLTREFPDADEIIAAGGALGKSPLWAQMLADALGRSVQMAHEEEATSRGAALVALRALGFLHDEGEASLVVERTVTPDGARHETYRAALARQQKLYTALFGGNA